jgi:DNA adenine methylase
MPDDITPTRPALRWHGGKWRLAPWIIQHFPPHRIYVEAFGGAASVLLQKRRSYAEIYNDLDGEVVNFFQVLRSPALSAALVQAVALTPFARMEFEESYAPAEDVVERARRLVVRSFMGFGANGHNTAVRTGFRANSNRSGTHPAMDWSGLPANLARIAARFAGVVIERRPALDILHQHDAADALHYLDPPYMPDTRSQKCHRSGARYHVYTHEMTDADHGELLAAAVQLRGMVILSGYQHRLYDDALVGWRLTQRNTHADGGRARRECLWLNPAADRALGGRLDLEPAPDA